MVGLGSRGRPHRQAVERRVGSSRCPGRVSATTDRLAGRSLLVVSSSRPRRAVESGPGRVDAVTKRRPPGPWPEVRRGGDRSDAGRLVSAGDVGRGGRWRPGRRIHRPSTGAGATLGVSSSAGPVEAAAGGAEPLRSRPGCVGLGGRLRGVDDRDPLRPAVGQRCGSGGGVGAAGKCRSVSSSRRCLLTSWLVTARILKLHPTGRRPCPRRPCPSHR